MNISEILRKHPSFVYADEMQDLVKPLQPLGVTYFSHTCLNNDGSLVGNSSNPVFLKQYLEEGYYQYDMHVSNKLIENRYILWDTLNLSGPSGDLYQSGVSLDVFHTFTIVDKTKENKNFYHFAAPYSFDSINLFYLQNLELLEKFVLYYKEQMLLNKHLSSALDMPCPTINADSDFYLDPDLNLLLEKNSRSVFLQAITTSANNKTNIPLGTREAECAFLLTQGKTNKEIGVILGISPRTVEEYLNRLKIRFNSRNKLELVADIIRSGASLE